MRWGLEDPGEGDLVVAVGYVLLPARDDRLIEPLQFRGRLKVMGDYLCDWWGKTQKALPPDFPPLKGEWKFKCCQYKGTTWREAMTAAWEHAHAELMKLEEALAHRKRVLEEAECPPAAHEAPGKTLRKIQIQEGGEQ
jgi:hypothetical protein